MDAQPRESGRILGQVSARGRLARSNLAPDRVIVGAPTLVYDHHQLNLLIGVNACGDGDEHASGLPLRGGHGDEHG